MLQRVTLGQVRFNLPGLTTDARGVAGGRELAARFAAIDRMVSFLRLLTAEQNLDDLSPGLRIVYARGGAGTREAIVLLPAAGAPLGDLVGQAARMAGGQAFTGAGKHFVQLRDGRAPLGYDVGELCAEPGDLALYGAEHTVAYRIESELPFSQLLLRLALVPAEGRRGGLPDGPFYLTARRGLGAVVAGYLHRVAGRSEGGVSLEARAALCETTGGGAFSPGAAFWLFRIAHAPARLHGLLSRTPGLEAYLPIGDRVAVAAGYRHPIHLESCQASFAPDRLHLFSPRGMIEVAPLPTLAAVEDIIRIRAPSPEIADPRLAAGTRPDLAVALRIEPGGEPSGWPVASLVPWPQVPWLQRLFYAMPPTALGAYRVALLERGVLLRANDRLAGVPFGTLYQLGAPDVLVPLGARLRPAVSPSVLAQRLGAAGGAWVLFPTDVAAPLRILPEAIAPLAERLLASLDPNLARLDRSLRPAPATDEPIEIEHEPLGPMPLWGLPRSR